MPSFAQESVIETDTPIGTDIKATPSAITISRVNYELPYPGMLPDHPLYFLKVIRDGIVKRLINDEMTMAKFSLKNAEKRVYAGKMLVEKGEEKLGVVTISKSNNYLEDALTAIENVKRQTPKNPDTKLFLQQFRTATLKNLEVVSDLTTTVSEQYQKQFLVEEKRIASISKRVERQLSEKK